MVLSGQKDFNIKLSIPKYEKIVLLYLLILSFFIFCFCLRNPGQKAEVSLRLSETVLALKEEGEEDIPKQHRLDVSTVTRQTLGVFSHIIR